LLLSSIDLICFACVFKNRNKGIGPVFLRRQKIIKCWNRYIVRVVRLCKVSPVVQLLICAVFFQRLIGHPVDSWDKYNTPICAFFKIQISITEFSTLKFDKTFCYVAKLRGAKKLKK
jgi:hypothetical protein